MPAAEWFEFSGFSPSASIRKYRRKAKLALIKEVAAKGRDDLGQLGDGIGDARPILHRTLPSQGCFGLQDQHGGEQQ
jgi:hypothetical protein